jgi:hypothetical protein
MAEGQAMSDDDARISEIRARHVAEDTPRGPECGECGCGWPCDSVYLLSSMIRAEEANTAVIRANAEEIADLEDVRDGLEAQVNAMTAENERGQQAFADLTLALVERINALEAERDEWKRINQSDNQCAARRLEQAESERDALAARLAASEAALRQVDTAANWVGRRNAWNRALQHVGQPPNADDACREVRQIVRAALAAASEGEGATDA